MFGQTTASVNQTVQALTQIVADIRSMVAAANAGDFSVKIAQAGKQGYTRELSGLLDPALLARLSLSRADAQKRIEACVDLLASVEGQLG